MKNGYRIISIPGSRMPFVWVLNETFNTRLEAEERMEKEIMESTYDLQLYIVEVYYK
jgi:hypothetical protein